MTDLTTTQNSTLAKPIFPALSQGLITLLDRDGSHEESARNIALNPAARAELCEVYCRIDHEATAKAGDEGVKAVIGRRFVLYPQPQRTEGEWVAWWGEYYSLLSDLPLSSVEAAMRAWTTKPESEFLPKPGKVREMALSTPTRALRRLKRADMALAYRPEPKYAPSTPEEIAASEKMREDVAQLLADTISKLGGGPDAERPKVRPNFAQVDETGISDAMRKLLALRTAR
jgi:hypothetical protein